MEFTIEGISVESDGVECGRIIKNSREWIFDGKRPLNSEALRAIADKLDRLQKEGE